MTLNKWKISFLILLIINIVIILTIFAFMLIPNKPLEEDGTKKIASAEAIPFLIKTQKNSLTDLINHYLEEETAQENLQYRVELKENVHVYGVIEAFNKEINMTMILEPKVKSDGNMQLLVKELSIGRLKLPVSYVLKYMNTNYNLPKYVKVDTGNNLINIQLDELKFKNGYTARAESFNLVNDDITFSLYVPLP